MHFIPPRFRALIAAARADLFAAVARTRRSDHHDARRREFVVRRRRPRGRDDARGQGWDPIGSLEDRHPRGDVDVDESDREG